MFSSVRKRLGVPGIIAVVALVFAMIGGAWAKGGPIITKLSQISSGVQKQLKGKVGPPGPTGPQGAAGAAGAAGKDGTNGTSGTNGKSVVTAPIAEGEPECNEFGGTKVEVEGSGNAEEVCNGETGFTETLPSGKTETGSFSAFVKGEEVAQISYAIPLTAALPAANVHITGDAGFATNCAGSAAAPKANSGHLCVYVTENAGPAVIGGPIPATSTLAGFFAGTRGSAASGAFLHFGAAEAVVWGTWAVTG